MSESPARQKVNELFPELLDGLRLLEGRFPANEIAARVVRAAMGQPGVAGARLWRADRGEAEVWAEAGILPKSTSSGMKPRLPSDTSKDPSIWAGALGSDDFRVRVNHHSPARPPKSTDLCWCRSAISASCPKKSTWGESPLPPRLPLRRGPRAKASRQPRRVGPSRRAPLARQSHLRGSGLRATEAHRAVQGRVRSLSDEPEIHSWRTGRKNSRRDGGKPSRSSMG